MDEFALIQRFFDRRQSEPSVLCGIGDDGAVLRLPPDRDLVVSVDSCVDGVHFPSRAPANLIAERALRTAASDLAAMGADPLWFTLALTLPSADESWLRQFSEGLFAAAEALDLVLVGGDTTRGALCISVQVQGSVPRGEAILRSGAREGDLVFVSGGIGEAALALQWIRAELEVDDSVARYLNERFYRPQARLALGRGLRGLATAAIDISDGLVSDLGHICAASKVGAHIDADGLPLSQRLRDLLPRPQLRALQLYGGDDYELCFSVPPARADEVLTLAEGLGVNVSQIGHIVAGQGILDIGSGAALDRRQGYRHFE